MNNATVCISKGNRKMGSFPSVSLPAVITCRERCNCAKECYALKIERIYKTARESYARNLAIYNEDPAEFWKQVYMAMSKTDKFRFGVSGDIPDKDYLSGIVKGAEKFPNCQVLVFTKRYEFVNEFVDNGGNIPENLHIIFSGWPGIPMDNPHNFPEAHVRFKSGVCLANDNAIECSGNCYECAVSGSGCMGLKHGEQVVFNQH